MRVDRPRATFVFVVLATAVWLATRGAPAVATDFVAGSGRADARVIRVGPAAAGRLSLAPSVALALADFVGTVGRGEARVVDYAALDDSAPAQAKDGAAPLRTDSTEEGAAQGRSASVGPFGQSVRASRAPSGWAAATAAEFDLPGVATVSGGRAEAAAGVDSARRVRSARGTVDIGRLSLAGGRVVLAGLHWELLQTTGVAADGTRSAAVAGGFRVGSAVVDGEVRPGPITGDDLARLFAAVNTALVPTGVVLDAPRLVNDQGAAHVTPLALRIVDSQVGRAALAPVLAAAQPARDPVVGGLLHACADCSSLVLLGDAGVGVVSGSGRFDIELGGTFATTEGQVFANPFLADTVTPSLAAPPRVPAAGEPVHDGGVAPAAVRFGGPPGMPPAPSAAPGLSSATRPLSGRHSTASALWALGLIGLAGAGAMASTDYRRLRAARRGGHVA